MSIVGWILIGAAAGLLANRLVPGRFPGGVLGTLFGGMAGAFIGGGVFSLIADRGVSGLDLISVLIAFIGAVLLLTAIRKAEYAEPRPNERINSRPKPHLH